MKKLFLLTILLSLTFIVKAQSFLSLDSCRALALANNKDLLISNEKINAAHYFYYKSQAQQNCQKK